MIGFVEVDGEAYLEGVDFIYSFLFLFFSSSAPVSSSCLFLSLCRFLFIFNSVFQVYFVSLLLSSFLVSFCFSLAFFSSRVRPFFGMGTSRRLRKGTFFVHIVTVSVTRTVALSILFYPLFSLCHYLHIHHYHWQPLSLSFPALQLNPNSFYSLFPGLS